MIKNTVLILFFTPFLIFSQSAKIKRLSPNINSYSSEFNFVQVNEKTAYFTSSFLQGKNYQSLIFSAKLKDGDWEKGRHINLGEEYSCANINFPEEHKSFYFTLCDKKDYCKIAYREYKYQTTKYLNENINLEYTTNTQPHVTNHGTQKVMYFASDRKGGYGGMDIWISVIDDKGNFGKPVNAGNKINSEFDEITPFYNLFSKELYFSSNRNQSLGGFDFFKALGRLNLWEEPVNVVQLNSRYNDTYLSFYESGKGYFSSNRPLSAQNTEGCCSDLFYFEIEKNKRKREAGWKAVSDLTPLKLYFHNDEPDCCTMDTTTKKTYQETYISYLKIEPEYTKKTPKLKSFFQDSLSGNFDKLNIILSHAFSELEKGKTIQLHIKGYSSPLHKKQYNINLSKRRIKSLINYVLSYNQKMFFSYIKAGKFQIVEMPFGEDESINFVSDDPNDKAKSIYSLDAMLARKIEIVEIKLID